MHHTRAMQLPLVAILLGGLTPHPAEGQSAGTLQEEIDKELTSAQGAGATPTVPVSQSGDLTGLWLDDTGGGAVYRVRQIGNQFYWIVDGTPRGSYVNMAFGTISGGVMTGQWVDLPGSPTLQNGRLDLRIESNNRMVKLSTSGQYSAQVWTRQGSTVAVAPSPPRPLPPPPPPPVVSGAPDITGFWLEDRGDGTGPHSEAVITQNGARYLLRNYTGTTSEGAFDGRRVTALGWAVTGTLSGDGNRISWSNGSAWTRSERFTNPSETRVWSYQIASQAGWQGTMTRRGTSDQYEVSLSASSGQRVSYVDRFTFEGNRVRFQRVQSSEGFLCTGEATLHPNGRTYVGTGNCAGGPSGWVWRITPEGKAFPGW